MNVILYTRVSTDEQAQGNSLDYQESFLRSYCQVNRHNVIDIYKEDASAKDFEHRPEIQKSRPSEQFAQTVGRFYDHTPCGQPTYPSVI